MFDQVPVDADSVCPETVDPVTVGSCEFTGTPVAAVTTAVCAEVAAVPGPDAFDAVTATRIVEPTSAATSG